MDNEKPVYLLVQLSVEDLELFVNDYVPGVIANHQRHGVEILVGAQEVEVIEGDYDQTFTVVLKFPSAEVQKAWYDDPEYQPFKELRQRITTPGKSTLVLAPAFEGI